MVDNPPMVRVEVSPDLLSWAQARSGLAQQALNERFPTLEEWRQGRSQPTLRQLEEFARATHTPIGFLFLDEPPDEKVPVPDFRTVGGAAVGQPSANLLDTLYQCQERQDWYREWARANSEARVGFVGSLGLDTPIERAAAKLRSDLEFEVPNRGSTWSTALTRLRDNAEDCGVLVMVSGIVGGNTHRKLDPQEFRGFSIADGLAPLVFVNGSDTRAAQIFTLAHELAHVWLGESALDDPDLAARSPNHVETWCNRVAAEMLVPLDELRAAAHPGLPTVRELTVLARVFKVSTLVVLRRIADADYITWHEYRRAYREELDRVMNLTEAAGTGGNFYNTQPVRVSKRFERSVIASTLEGQTRYTDAFRMLGFKKQSTFDELARRLATA